MTQIFSEYINNSSEMQTLETETIEIEIINKIYLALDEVRPYLMQDGGDIEFIRYEANTKVAVFRFLGNCVNCPMAIMTLRAGVERYVLHFAPEIRRIEAIR